MGNILPDVFLEIVNMSITAAYVALAVIIIRLVLKKAPKAVSYALWLVVLFRLVCPVSFSSPVSLMRMGNVAPAMQQGASVTYIQIPVAAYHIPAPAAVATAAPVNTASVPAPVAAAVPSPVETLLLIAAAVWAAGVAVMLVLSVVSHIRLKRRISDATLLYDNIYETDAIQSPFVMGIFRPRIYLPSGMDSGDMEYVLRHERMHIHRHDNVVKPLAYAVLCLHWFNPLVWAAFYLMCADMEMSCDEKVLRGMGERDKACYGEALLKLSTNRRLLAGSPLAFGETPVKSRIKNVLKFKKPVFWIAAVAVVAAIAAGICLIANPSGTVSAGADSLYGNYKFEKQVYMCPLSSFLALDGYEQYYTLDGDTLTITEALGEQQSIPVTYERKEVSEQDFDASFMSFGDSNIGGVPDISQYKQRCQYTLCNAGGNAPGYRLYVMDNEVWLAKLNYNEKLNGPNNEYIWSIYKIARYEGEVPPIHTIYSFNKPVGADLISGTAIKDKDINRTIKDAIATLSSTTYKAVDMSKVGNFITLSADSNETGKEEYYTYYIFNMDGKHCIQGAREGLYSYISEDAYDTISTAATEIYQSSDTASPSQTIDPAGTGTWILPSNVEITLYIGGDSDREVPIEDDVLKNYIQDSVIDYVSSPTTGEGVDISTLDSYLALSGQFTSDGGQECYYIFEKDGKYYIQGADEKRCSITDSGFYNELLKELYDTAENDPTKTPRDVEISMYIGGDSDSDVPIEDNMLLLAEDVVTKHMLSSAAWEGIDVTTLDSYLVLNGQFDGHEEPESFYIYEKDGKHCIQSSAKGRYSIIDEAAYYELLDKALGYDSAGTMTITTGDNAVYALEHIISTEVSSLHGDSPRLKPEQVAKYLQYLSIDIGKAGLTPFTPYLNGEKTYGTYKLYDSDFNEIPVIQPSGLEPQAFLFANAPGPGTYIVELEATSNIGNMEYKSQYFFGVMLTGKE